MSNALEKTADLSAAEKRALLAKLLREKGKGSRPADDLAHHLFEAQARRTPDAVALAFGDLRLTYRELNARANRLAHHLRKLGVGPEVLVGLCVDRSAEMVVGLLGILKAGGAYVPLDPAFPAERLAFMLEDARVPVLLTQEGLRDALAAGDAKVLCLDSGWGQVEEEADDDPAGGATAANLAYVIYTSGSTGRPKGVQIPHGALANFLRSMREVLGLTDRDALLAVTTLSFDIAALEIFLPLIQGGRLELVGRDVASDGSRLAEAIDRLGITYLQATPATWRLLIAAGWAGSPGLTVLCGGEALPRDLADRLLERGRGVWNLYGPTETTIWSSAAQVEPGEGPVPIGRPIAETQLYVLDARMRPVPVGVAGELYIGGAGLARGYLGRPSLTAERFLPDPFGKAPGGRIYRTGDLARWRPDGGLECLGRVDHQVKIRGFRIELGEIEVTLRSHPAVREAVVVAREDQTGDRRLVAYLVGRPLPTAAELRAWLKEKLPDYMVPAAFVPLAELPLTPNGKVDRNALPAPDQGGGPLEGAHVAPRGPIEEALAGIWGEVLGRDRVGVRDNFFDIGGHSLMAAQLLSRLRDTFGVELPLRDLFDAPTLADQARRLEDALRAGSGLEIPPLRPTPRDRPLPASFAQQRLWFLDQLEPGSPVYNIPAAVRLAGTLDVAALGRAIGEVVRRHEALRTTLATADGLPVQVIAPSLDVELPIADISHLPEADREAEAMRLAQEEARRPFDLARGPLVRAALVRLAPDDHVALVTTHHVVSDGWSIGVLIYEVAVLYEAFTRGAPSPLPDLPIQYADYAAWQLDWLQGDVLRDQIAYWERQLAGVPALDLPTDRPRAGVASPRGGVRSATFPKEVVDGARALGRQEGATMFMTLLAAFQALLHRYTGQEDFAVGSPIAGRTRSEVEGLIGFFANTFVLRSDLAGEPSFRELLRRAKRSSLGAFAHQDLPFHRLVEALRPGREPGRTPLFQVMFVFQNAPLPALEAPGLKLTPIETDSGMAKFDLTLAMIEDGGGLKATLEYDAELFDPATADRMLGHLRTLLEGAIAQPDQPVAALPMLTEAERAQVLRRWDDAPGEAGVAPAAIPEDLDQLSEDELDALLAHLESGHDAQDA